MSDFYLAKPPNDFLTHVENRSNRFKEGVVFRDVFDETFFSEADLLEIFRIMAEVDRYDVNLRVYIDHGLRHDYEIKILQNPPQENESLSNWLNKIFGDQMFCIAINNLEKFNDNLTQRAAKLFDSWNRNNRIPGAGIDMGIFMGNYNETPFGIHHDGTGVTILHCHLGPADKDIYLWDTEWYENYTGGSDSSFLTGDLMSYGERYRMKPNSCFFLPCKYHIGINHGFSTTLTFGMKELSSYEMIENSMGQVVRYLIDQESLNFLDRNNSNDNTEKIVSKEFLGMTATDLVFNSLEDYKLSIKSNGGFEYSPKRKVLPYSDSQLPSLIVNLKDPFQILYKNIECDSLVLFVRRNRLFINKDKGISSIIKLLNRGEQVCLENIQDLCALELSEKEIYNLIRVFIELGVLEYQIKK